MRGVQWNMISKGVIVDFQAGIGELFKLSSTIFMSCGHVLALSSDTFFMAFLRQEKSPSHLFEFF
jgi:hypothetical protein